MKTIKNVQGTQTTVPALEINVDTVYKRDNIIKLTDENGRYYWQYDETQMTLNEYFKTIIPNNENAIGELSILFATYQTQIDNALAELSILIGGIKNV